MSKYPIPMLRSLCIFGIAGLAAACSNTGANGETKISQSSCAAGKQMGVSKAGLAQKQLCIISGNIIHSFTTEMAIAPQEQMTGLMYRRNLDDNAAMLFPFPEPKMAGFWMKNTFIPLDIIFIRADGSIESIAENTIPHSEIPVSSGEKVAAVLEVRGGLTAELDIKPGDKIKWR